MRHTFSQWAVDLFADSRIMRFRNAGLCSRFSGECILEVTGLLLYVSPHPSPLRVYTEFYFHPSLPKLAYLPLHSFSSSSHSYFHSSHTHKASSPSPSLFPDSFCQSLLTLTGTYVFFFTYIVLKHSSASLVFFPPKMSLKHKHNMENFNWND